jgi:superfamily II DNA or RNA helicase
MEFYPVQGLYEQLITKLVRTRLNNLDEKLYLVKDTLIDREEAARFLSTYLCEVIFEALRKVPKTEGVEKQIEIANQIVFLLRDTMDDNDFEESVIDVEGKILSAIFKKLDFPISNFDEHLRRLTPYTRFSQSELFTGSNVGISLESEIRKEILSADRVYFLVSFIKWTGIRIFEKELKEFTESGRTLKIITTSYMGATDLKAVEFLSKLNNTEVKVSYNSDNERLHAKAYLFLRNSGFHTGYIGSSNLSRSALTNGLEWNLKVTTKEIGHIIDKFQKTFETYWEDSEFEIYNSEKDKVKLSKALKNEKNGSAVFLGGSFFDIKPFPFQSEILDHLEAERTVHNRYRNLVVAATGTGKTVISAFDYKKFRQKNVKARLLFIAHRKEILQQALATFRGVLKDNNFGELWVDGLIPDNYDHVFASIQTLNSQHDELTLSAGYFDYIIVDEVHHIAANSYRPILAKFSPQILLGLTATPERMDGENILTDFCNTIAAEIRLPEALNRKLLSPFQYFGLSDSVDLSRVEWKGGKYVPGELTKVYTRDDVRVGQIIRQLEEYLNDLHDVRALGFCVGREHAQYMAEKFTLAGLKADYLVSGNNGADREQVRDKLLKKDINYLFVVDIFNEGVDIPEIDTVLFLRPTESLTVFLQQLGRGLRLAEGKECLTVLDFVGNSRAEYDFESKFRALIGKTNSSVLKEVENEFPHLPLGCSIVLEKKAKEYIIKNIKEAVNLSRSRLLSKILNYQHQTALPLTLENFVNLYHIPLPAIYKKDSWKRLCVDAQVLPDFPEENQHEILRAIKLKWLSTTSLSYFRFIRNLASSMFDVQVNMLTPEEQLMCLMLHYDVWKDTARFNSFSNLTESICAIGKNAVLVDEIIDVIGILISRVDFVEKDIDLGYACSLKVHSRYTRDQVLAAFGLHTFETASSSREGVVFSEKLNTELLFVTLTKSEKDFSPTTLYHDYAISDTIFHWQSQNKTTPTTTVGLSYINQQEQGKTILLFVREASSNEFGGTLGFVFLGRVNYMQHNGSKPMNINWRLQEPIPAYFWKESAKVAVG